MKVEIRKTLSGTEYWDNEEKRTVFVPKGEKPKFEVTKKPKSMLDDGHNPGVGIVDETADEYEVDLDDMTAEQLIEFAEENGIEIPGNMKKEETIRKYIAEKLTADTE
mgnify:CR=1 FL=1